MFLAGHCMCQSPARVLGAGFQLSMNQNYLNGKNLPQIPGVHVDLPMVRLMTRLRWSPNTPAPPHMQNRILFLWFPFHRPPSLLIEAVRF